VVRKSFARYEIIPIGFPVVNSGCLKAERSLSGKAFRRKVCHPRHLAYGRISKVTIVLFYDRLGWIFEDSGKSFLRQAISLPNSNYDYS